MPGRLLLHTAPPHHHHHRRRRRHVVTKATYATLARRLMLAYSGESTFVSDDNACPPARTRSLCTSFVRYREDPR